MADPAPAAEREDILIVEDSQLYASFFKTVFASTAYSISFVNDGAVAWARLQARLPRILLLDWNLPGLDGITICRRLREEKRTPFVFIIMLTSMQRLEDVMAGFDAGADDYMVKPFEPAVLKAKVRVGMRLAELEASNANKVQLLARANLKQQALIEDLQEKNRTISKQAQDLQAVQKQLVDTARRAGMAEIATSVLHNVGNLLNTATTSSTVILEALGRSRLSTLTRLTEMLHTQPEGFARFVATDPRGQKLPEFLSEIATALGREHQMVVDKLQVLIESQEQIRQIIALQQSYAGVAGIKDSVSLPALVDDATRLFVESFKKHDILIVCDYEKNLPPINVEKNKALQILINLLQNARDATRTCAAESRSISITATTKSPGMMAIAVTDNGIGISPENMERIFSFGFTTKAGGHGFGLHGCVNLAREMGGDLSAASPGPGMGATLTLTLPIK